MRKCHFLLLFLLLTSIGLSAQVRQRLSLDEGWEFAFGDASSPERDFGCGTEYFNYLTKAASIHNEGPYSPKFQPEKWGKEWTTVSLPHDWVVSLPYAAEASHSHGYKQVGYRYPSTSVGWYRKHLPIAAGERGSHFILQFDGIFRDSRVWINGFYLGGEPSGYAQQTYDITEYLNYGGDNLICVRADATLEEGWFYEGAGIYRHTWLVKTHPLHVAPCGTFAQVEFPDQTGWSKAVVQLQTTVDNQALTPSSYRLVHRLLDAEGQEVATATHQGAELQAKASATTSSTLEVSQPHLWSTESPYLYKIITEVWQEGQQTDSYTTRIGLRHVAFDADRGFLLNGRPLKLKGVNMHQDHAGVGSAMPDALQRYRLLKLKEMGCNAYRASHNPMTPETLEACDELGLLVIEENRLTGINREHLRLLEQMIRRDRNHPCIILWSVGNEEWGIEWKEQSEWIVASLREYVHRMDPSRLMTVATSGGPNIVKPADVAGYNYILQNPVEQHRADYPARCAVGTEETSGCGTRGVYFPDAAGSRMPAINRSPQGPDSLYNCIERGWQFYDARPWLGGLFYWTGFDYRGEPNPLKYPATGSQFGLYDYCGFPKDEVWYLKAWWTDEPVLHLLPHWNLQGHEGELIDVWAYSNCDEVELRVNGRSYGRQPMPRGGHLSWKVPYQPGRLQAIGYKQGRRQLTTEVRTTGPAMRLVVAEEYAQSNCRIYTVQAVDAKGRLVPDACIPFQVKVEGEGVRILGCGNGDSAWQAPEQPTDAKGQVMHLQTFNGVAQIILKSGQSAPLQPKITSVPQNKDK